MGIYYLVFLIIFIADTYYGYFNKNKMALKEQGQSVSKVAFIALFLLFALRHPSMGIDLGYYGRKAGYLYSFDKIGKYPWDEILEGIKWQNYEYGYIVFNKLISSIYNNRQFFLAVCSFVCIAPVMRYISKKSSLPFLSVVIYMGLPVFLITYSGLRQAIAVSITMLATIFIEEKKPVKFLITVCIATLFHYSAYIFLVAYPIYYIKLNNVWRQFSVICIPLVFLFRKPLYEIFGRIFKDTVVADKTGAVTLFLVFLAVYIYLITFNRDCEEDQNGMINLFYVACIVQSFASVSNIAMRVGYYFMPYLMIAIPNTITKNKDKQEYQTNYVLVLLTFMAYSIYAIRTSTWAMAYPYYFFWD